jgi:micrococcal nuclease
MLKPLLFSLLCLIFLVSCRSPSLPQGKMVQIGEIISGQTVEILGQNKEGKTAQKLRLLGIEAPDLKQDPWGQAAKNRLEQLIKGQTVLLEVDDQDKDEYDRLWGYLWSNDPKDTLHQPTLINEQLIKEGYVLYTPQAIHTQYEQKLANAQDYARIMGLGIWDHENPMRLTPKEFRRQYR